MPAHRDSLNLLVRQFALALQRAGWAIGLLSAFVFAVLAVLLRGNPAAPAVAAVAALAAAMLLAGAAQESALFRMAEGLLARGPGAAASAGHGVIALVVVLAARITLVAALGSQSEAGVLAALFAAPVVSRFAPVLAAHWLDGDADAAAARAAALWCVLPLLVMLLAGGWAFVLLALLVAAAGWIAMLRFFRRHPAPLAEERRAALQQVCEVAFYLGAAVGA